MSDSQQVALREKQEVTTKDEKTVPGRFYAPATDIYETEEALTVVMEMPGVNREHVNISLENNRLRVEGRIDVAHYEEMEPVYTEYIIGHYARGFALSGKINRDGITAQLDDGVLTLTLPKEKEAIPRRIAIS